MTAAGSVEGDGRLRLFAALPLPAPTLEHLASWQVEHLAGTSAARLVARENLHVTLAFLGSTPASDVEGILGVLRESGREAERPVLRAVRYRETRSVGMVVLDDEQGRATGLSERVGEGLERLGVYAREGRKWLPHVTVLRFRRPPRIRPPLPDLGPVSPSEVALYHSVLRPTGAQYEILQSVPLGG